MSPLLQRKASQLIQRLLIMWFLTSNGKFNQLLPLTIHKPRQWLLMTQTGGHRQRERGGNDTDLENGIIGDG
jgi:hypothetical protein